MIKFHAFCEYIIELTVRPPASGICRATLAHQPYAGGLLIAVSLVVGHIGPEGLLVECLEFIGDRTCHGDSVSQEVIAKAQRRMADAEARIRALGLTVAMGRYAVDYSKAVTQ